VNPRNGSRPFATVAWIARSLKSAVLAILLRLPLYTVTPCANRADIPMFDFAKRAVTARPVSTLTTDFRPVRRRAQLPQERSARAR